jgi:ribosome modulation factor
MKYVIVSVQGVPTPILFPDHLNHCDMVPQGCKVTAAGFFHIEEGKVLVHDGSTSLGMKSRDIDARVLQDYLFDGVSDAVNAIHRAQWMEEEEERKAVTKLNEARASGRRAFKKGAKIEDCSYSDLSMLQEWRAGWRAEEMAQGQASLF